MEFQNKFGECSNVKTSELLNLDQAEQKILRTEKKIYKKVSEIYFHLIRNELPI